MKRGTYLGCAGVALVLAFQSAYGSEAPAFLQFVRPLGMGGAFTAVADDQNTFFFNPAGMVQRTGGQLTLLEVSAGGSKDLKDAYDFIHKNQDDLTNFNKLPPERQAELTNEIDDTISKLDPRATVGADMASYVSGPHFLGMPLHVGFGAFAIVDASFKMDSGVLVPNITYNVNNDIVLPLSIAHRWDAPWRIPGKIGVGFTAKLLRRNQIKQEKVSVLQLDSLDAPPLTTGHGFGSDLGLLYQPTDRTNIGLMVQDFLGTKMKFDALDAQKGFAAQPERDTVIRPRTNVGIALVPRKLLWLVPTSDRWTFSADVRDILGSDDHLLMQDGFTHVVGEDFYTHLHLGAEFRYWFLRFRGGAYQGYPSFGLGLDIPVIKIDFAAYSQELGAHSGDRRQQNYVLSLALRFGSGYTESRERIKKAKESSKAQKNIEPDAPETTEAAPAAATGKSSKSAKPATPSTPAENTPPGQ